MQQEKCAQTADISPPPSPQRLERDPKSSYIVYTVDLVLYYLEIREVFIIKLRVKNLHGAADVVLYYMLRLGITGLMVGP